MNEVVVGGLTALITAIITWFFSRKKQVLELEANELDNVEKATKIWRGLAENLKLQVDELREGQKRIVEENSRLRHEIGQLERNIHELTDENKKLRELIETSSNGAI